MNYTFGYELELGDVLRSRVVPERLGAWEYAETAIVNFNPPYRHVAGDPLGIAPPMGGEVNVYPGRSPDEVAERVMDIVEFFRKAGDAPTTSCVSHGHVHVRVEGLRDDLKLLHRLTRWVKQNQAAAVDYAYDYKEAPFMRFTSTARNYLKYDGGRLMPDWMADNIIRSKDFDDFIRLHCCGKDGKTRGRPLRYAFNMYCLKHNDTMEFRFFRSSLDFTEIRDSIRLCRDLLDAALCSDASVQDIISGGAYILPKLRYDHEAYIGWERTKYSNDRGQKQRYFRSI